MPSQRTRGSDVRISKVQGSLLYMRDLTRCRMYDSVCNSTNGDSGLLRSLNVKNDISTCGDHEHMAYTIYYFRDGSP